MTNFDINEIKRKNLRRIMDEHGHTPTSLADLISKKQSHISACLGGGRNIGEKTIELIATKLNIDKSEFYRMETIGLPIPERYSVPVPVISWIHAGAFSEPTDQWPAGVSGEGEPVFSYRKVGPHAFGLRVKGDSMAPRYLPGDTIIVDPEIRCESGNPCIVWLNGEVTFKLIHETETTFRLVALNERVPEITVKKGSPVDFKIIGKVIDMMPKL